MEKSIQKWSVYGFLISFASSVLFVDKLFQRKKVGTHEPPLCSANFQLFVMHHFLLFFQLPHTLLKMQNYILRVKQIHNPYFD